MRTRGGTSRWWARSEAATASSSGWGNLVAHGFWLTEHDVFGNDDHLCALSVMGVKRGETEVQTRVVSVFHFREGKQLERWLYREDMTAWEKILPQ